MLYSSDEDQVM